MKRVIGIFLIGLLTYGGFLGLNGYTRGTEPSSTVFAREQLTDKLQKTMLLIGSVDRELKKPVKRAEPALSKPSPRLVEASFLQKKESLLRHFKTVYQSLEKSNHVFRHELREIEGIMRKSTQREKLLPREVYARNWSNYMVRNIDDLRVSEGMKSQIISLVKEIPPFIKEMTKTERPSVSNASINAAQESQELSMAKMESDRLSYKILRKSLGESLEAFEAWKTEVKSLRTDLSQLPYLWVVFAALISLVALWMSSSRGAEKHSLESRKDFGLEEDIFVEQLPSSWKDKGMDEVSIPHSIDEELFNSLGNLYQAKGVRLGNFSLDELEESLNNHDKEERKSELEGFLKIILSAIDEGRGSTMNVSGEMTALNTYRLMASLTSEESLMTFDVKKLGIGFKDLTEVLSTRNPVFNIEQNMGEKDIHFIMELEQENAVEEKDFDDDVEGLLEV